jgi:hypothetical protein
METTMQNLADCLADSYAQPLSCEQAQQQLSTFMVYNLRRKVRGRRHGRCCQCTCLALGALAGCVRCMLHSMQLVSALGQHRGGGSAACLGPQLLRQPFRALLAAGDEQRQEATRARQHAHRPDA